MYTVEGPEDELGNPMWKVGDNRFGVYRTGEAVFRATANASYLIGETIESADLYYNGQKVGDYLTATNSSTGGPSLEYILHTTSKYRYKNALYCEWGYESAGTGVPGEIKNTLLNKTFLIANFELDYISYFLSFSNNLYFISFNQNFSRP